MTNTSENPLELTPPHEPASNTTEPEAAAPQAPSLDETPSPKPSDGFRMRARVNGE